MTMNALDAPRYYLNRHVEWLEFSVDEGSHYVTLQDIMSTPLKDPHLCERVCTEILSSYLADMRKARILGSDGKYSRPNAARNSHGFSVQEHLMHVAAQPADAASATASRRRVLRTPSVVYTSSDVTTPSSGHSAEPDTQESSNAAV